MKKVIIASKNPVKVEATRVAFMRTFSQNGFEFESISVSSGVSEQPKGDEEVIQGAKNRANNAMDSYPEADYWVGIEGGVEEIEGRMGCFSWVVVKSKDKTGKARGNVFFLPDEIIKLVKEGKELAEADDIVFERENSNEKNGSVGILTKDIIDRTDYYYVTLILALIPFRNSELY